MAVSLRWRISTWSSAGSLSVEHLALRADLGLICACPLLTQTPLPPNHSALTSVAGEHMKRMPFPPTKEFTRTLTVAQGVILVEFRNNNAHDNMVSRSYRVRQWDFLI